MNTNQERLGVPILITDNKTTSKKLKGREHFLTLLMRPCYTDINARLRYHKEATDNTSYKYIYKHPQ